MSQENPSRSNRCDCRDGHNSSSGRCNAGPVIDPINEPGQVAICEDCRRSCKPWSLPKAKRPSKLKLGDGQITVKDGEAFVPISKSVAKRVAAQREAVRTALPLSLDDEVQIILALEDRLETLEETECHRAAATVRSLLERIRK